MADGEERKTRAELPARLFVEGRGIAHLLQIGLLFGCASVVVPNDGRTDGGATVFCTIHDYIAMRIAVRSRPVTDATDAASLGLFDVKRAAFDEDAIASLGMDTALLPAVAKTPCIGKHGEASVFVAIGDNQASFLGATGGKREGMLVNVGTGSQFSAYSEEYIASDALETRPFPGGGYLLVGASLCGGRAYALLEKFFREAAEMLGVDCARAYDAMDALAAKEDPIVDPITVTPLFSGTRKNPALRGKIEGLSTENFTPRHLVTGMMEGMARELYDMYAAYLASGGKPSTLYGSGNGLRVNPYLQKCFERLFALPLLLSNAKEEAATGAALFALMNA